ncbi:hypothetical protein DYB32_007702 [Aphanomyces invadans]|uniref:Uncharacterized protein n=1 Tax=Aphanomyces invadans TaxID=157072 RepID=A0A3R6Z1B9_9STRA|nr:hypothetical protein DYB32_007702 [Aphanomyces invadans]
MELTLLNLFKIKERHLGPQIRGSILYVPRPRVDGTSSEASFQPPVRRVFTNGSNIMTSRSSILSQSSLTSNASLDSELPHQYFPIQQRLSISSSVASPLPSTCSWVSATSAMPDIVQVAPPRPTAPVKMNLFVPSPVLPSATLNFEAQVRKHMETIGKMLHDDDLHLLSPPAKPIQFHVATLPLP